MHVVTSAEWVVIIGFIGTFIALYGSALFVLIRPLISPKERVPKLGGTGAMILFLAALGLIFAAYALFVEPYQLDITHVRLPIDGLPASTAPIRIVQISDLHCDAQMRLEDRIPKEIRKIKPDLIFFTGDACNSIEGYPNFYRCIKDVQQIAPLYCVEGDWDIGIGSFGPFQKAGLAAGGMHIVPVHGTKLCIIQMECDASASAREAASHAPKGMPVIVLTHAPDQDVVFMQDMFNIDLLCCGHTHGGQIDIPFYGALITQTRTGRPYSQGLHQIGSGYVYTNRGIGEEGHFPRVRFCCPPELTVFELVPSGKPKGWRGTGWYTSDAK